MSYSFQDSVRSVMQRNKKNHRLSQDVSSSEFSTKSIAESAASTASWPPANIKRRSFAVGIVNAIGGCFVPSKSRLEDPEYSFQDVSGKMIVSFIIDLLKTIISIII